MINGPFKVLFCNYLFFDFSKFSITKNIDILDIKIVKNFYDGFQKFV